MLPLTDRPSAVAGLAEGCVYWACCMRSDEIAKCVPRYKADLPCRGACCVFVWSPEKYTCMSNSRRGCWYSAICSHRMKMPRFIRDVSVRYMPLHTHDPGSAEAETDCMMHVATKAVPGAHMQPPRLCACRTPHIRHVLVVVCYSWGRL
jgi:hypothetical protein